MKILITGGAGFIGSHLAEHFNGAAEVTVLDNLSSGEPDNLDGLGNCSVTFGSVLNRLAVRRAMEGVDYVFHLAGMASIDNSFDRQVEYAEVESLGTLIVLEEAAKAGVKKVVYASSGTVYGEWPAVYLPRRENSQMEPKSPYAASKLAGEVYCQMFTIDKKLSTVCARLFNVFGPRQNQGVISAFIYRALHNRPLVINGSGSKVRDFIYVKSAVAALAFLGLKSTATGAYNIGSGLGMSLMTLARRVIDSTGSFSEIHDGPELRGELTNLVADISHISDEGFTPSCDFDKELRMTIADFRSKMSV